MDRKYLRIYNEIVSLIESGTYQPNDMLPSEKTLIQDYGVSRDTVRKSLNLLEQNGYIQKIKGKGSFVLDMSKVNFPVSGVVSFKEVSQKMGRHSNTVVEQLFCDVASRKISKDLELNENQKVWTVIRSRSIDDEKVILDKDYLVEDVISSLTEEVCQNSLYEYIENELELTIAYAKKEITVQMATEEDHMYLDMKNFDMIVVVKSYTYLDNNTLFQYTESRHRPDKFIFVDFARRMK